MGRRNHLGDISGVWGHRDGQDGQQDGQDGQDGQTAQMIIEQSRAIGELGSHGMEVKFLSQEFTIHLAW